MTLVSVRETTRADLPGILALYPLVFPGEDLTQLVHDLAQEPSGVISLVGTDAHSDRIVAHVIFTLCHVDGGGDTVALLGPLGVHPDHQGQGIGTALLHAGLDRMTQSGVSRVFVLGDPGYYGRFGFRPEGQVKTPYPIPEDWSEAWQSVTLAAGAPPKAGSLRVPDPWRDPALWTE